jgi:hypothetical protein
MRDLFLHSPCRHYSKIRPRGSTRVNATKEAVERAKAKMGSMLLPAAGTVDSHARTG